MLKKSKHLTEAAKGMEKYFVGFDFYGEAGPSLLVGEHNGVCVVATKFITDKKLVEGLYSALTGKKYPISSQE